MDAAVLRKTIRAARRAVSDADRNAMSEKAAIYALAYLERHAVQSVGVYLAMREEIDCAPLAAMLWAKGYKLYLPVVHQKNAPLYWRTYTPNSTFTEDALQIPVPALEKPSDERKIAPDFTVLPLVAYDSRGTRMGMGGGYYDRSFAAKTANQRLLGLAYSLQQVPKLPRQSWDIPLHALANEHTLLTFS